MGVNSNTDDQVHTTLLRETLSLHPVCTNGILEFEKKDGWVPNLVGKMIPACNGIVEQAVGWKQIDAATDGVHLLESGYEKMVESLT